MQSRFFLGAVGGALLAAVGFVVWGVLAEGESSPSPPPTAAPSTVTETTAAPATTPWVEPGEVQFESTILLPGSITVDDGIARLDYQLASLAPPTGVEHDAPDGEAEPLAAYPDRWKVTLVSGVSTDASVEHGAESVRFELRDGTLAEHITNVTLTGWRVAVPAGERLALDLTPGTSITFAGGTTLTVDTVLEQANATIVQIEFDHPPDHWDEIGIAPVDGSWRTGGRQGGGLQFIWQGSDAPGVVEIEQTSPSWVAVEGDVVVFDANR